MSRVGQMVPVFYAGRSLAGKPACYVTYEYARDEVHAFLAKWVKGCKGIQLLRTEAELKLKDQSATMGPHVIEKVAAGSPYYAALLEGWASR